MANEVLFSNYLRTVLSNSLNDSDTTFDVIDGSGFPSISGGDWFYIVATRLQDNLKEIMKVTARTGNTFTVSRGQDGTPARTFAQNDRVELTVNAGTLEDMRTQFEAADTSISGTLASLSNDISGNDTDISNNASSISALTSTVGAIPTLVTPVGGIIDYYGSVSNFDGTGLGLAAKDTSGWALCNGNNGTPDLGGFFTIGYDSADVSYNTIGNTGGEEEHTLVSSEVPDHTHTYDKTGVYNAVVAIGSGASANGGFSAGTATGSYGGGGAHNNMPPYFVLGKIMKV